MIDAKLSGLVLAAPEQFKLCIYKEGICGSPRANTSAGFSRSILHSSWNAWVCACASDSENQKLAVTGREA